MKEKWIAEMTELNLDCEVWWHIDLEKENREDIIKCGLEKAKECYLNSFRIGRVSNFPIPSIDVGSFLDNARDYLYDIAGEASVGYLENVTIEEECELETMLNEVFYQWHKQNDLFPNCLTVYNEEIINVEEILI